MLTILLIVVVFILLFGFFGGRMRGPYPVQTVLALFLLVLLLLFLFR